MTISVRKVFLIYAAAFAVAGITPFLLLPVLTHVLTPLQFGEISSFLILTALLGNVAGLTAHGYVSVQYFKTEPGQFSTVVSSSIAAIVVAHLGMALLVVVLFPVIANVLNLPLHFAVLAPFAALLLSLNLVFLAIFQCSRQPWFYLGARALQATSEVLLCLALLFLAFTDARARILSYVVAIAASAGLGLYITVRKGYLRSLADTGQARSLLAFGVPMLPHVIAGSAITYVDRLVVSSLLGARSLGVYMVAMQFGMAMAALNEPLNKALTPWLFEKLAKGGVDARLAIVRNTYQLFVALAVVGVVVAVGAHVLFDRVIGGNYIAARPLIPWMIGGFVLQGMYYAVVNYLFYAERTGTLSIITGSTAVIGVAISYGMTSTYGIQGAGMSFVINKGLLFLLVWYAAYRVVPMPWRLARKDA